MDMLKNCFSVNMGNVGKSMLMTTIEPYKYSGAYYLNNLYLTRECCMQHFLHMTLLCCYLQCGTRRVYPELPLLTKMWRCPYADWHCCSIWLEKLDVIISVFKKMKKSNALSLPWMITSHHSLSSLTQEGDDGTPNAAVCNYESIGYCMYIATTYTS